MRDIAGKTTPIHVRGVAVAALSYAVLLASVALSNATQNAVLLEVGGRVNTPLALTAEDLANMPRATATQERRGETSTYEGVLLFDILQKAGVPTGMEMPGKPMSSYILATARDGYQVVFALAEIDPAFVGARVLIADRQNGGQILPYERPLKIIAPQDKIPARSMYSLVKIEVVQLRQ